MIRQARALIAVLILSACVPRGAITELVPLPQSAAAQTQQIHVVTTRSRLSGPPFFGGQRAAGPSYARFEVSVPNERPLGQITWRRDGAARPDRHFLTTGHRAFDHPRALERSLRQQLAKLPQAERDVVVFVHGFNTNFPEALYRMAQVQADFDVPGRPVLFSWPSAAHTGGYLYDRDSTLIARNALADTLVRLDRVSGGRVTLVGFSMGGFLAVETLRQMAGTGQRGVLARLDGVVLVSPDIDLALFRASAGDMRPFPQPFVVLASRQDRALGLAALITGQKARLGSLESLQGHDLPGVTLIDVSAFKKDAETSHTVALTSPTLIQIMRGALDYQRSARPRHPETSGGLALDATVQELRRRILAHAR